MMVSKEWRQSVPGVRVLGAILLLAWAGGQGVLEAQIQRDPPLVRHLEFLASDALRGRGNAQPELEIAARYIARQFQKYGLEPAGEDGGYFQTFPVTTAVELGADSLVTFFALPSQPVRLEMGKDYWPVAFGPTKNATGPLVFAGYGISAPENNYDDYGEIDARGKIVVAYEHEPREGSPNSPFGVGGLSTYSSVLYKVRTARAHGAVGLILIPDDFHHPMTLPGWRPEPGPPLENLGIQVIRLSRTWGNRLIRITGRDPFEMRRWLEGHLTPYSFDIEGVQAALSLDMIESQNPVRNVAGLLRGESDELIVVGAHYDHLGLGGVGSLFSESAGEIHNGADDNASGTAALLQIAHDLSLEPRRRNVLFLAFAGEELGLLGSRHYVDRPLYALENTIAMLNMDMIGRSSGDLMVGGVGTAREFRTILEELDEASPLGFRYAETPLSPSDHLPFAEKGVPVLFFFSGLHGDYHKPSDDSEKIDYQRTFQVAEVVKGVLRALDGIDLEPAPGGGWEPEETSADFDLNRNRAPSFGSVPDMDYVTGGVRLQQVVEGSPAEQAGIQAGDILVGFGGVPVRSLYDFTSVLRRLSPGEAVEVVLLRDGRELRFTVLLRPRP